MNSDQMKVIPKRRRWARQFALQSLYQWSMTNSDISIIEQQFIDNKKSEKVDLEYYKEILNGAVQFCEEIDSYIGRYIDRKISEIDPVELSILRVSTYELLKRLDVPARVILNEALELSKSFGATDGYKFVNGILDKISKEVRRAEMNQ